MSWNPISDVPLKQMYLLAVFENIINKNIKHSSTFYLHKRVIMLHFLQNKVEPDTTSKILKDKKKQGKSKKWYNGSGELVKKTL